MDISNVDIIRKEDSFDIAFDYIDNKTKGEWTVHSFGDKIGSHKNKEAKVIRRSLFEGMFEGDEGHVVQSLRYFTKTNDIRVLPKRS